MVGRIHSRTALQALITADEEPNELHKTRTTGDTVENSYEKSSSLRPRPLLTTARCEGSAFGGYTGALVSLYSGDALTAFGGGLRSAG